MDDILTELNRETLAAVCQGEIIIPSIVQSMRAEQVGVTAIGAFCTGGSSASSILGVLSRSLKV